MKIIKQIKNLLPKSFKNWVKKKLQLDLIIWIPSKLVVEQKITVKKHNKTIKLYSNGDNPIADTVFEVFDHDCYFIDHYINILNNSLVFDVGANVGVYSTFVASLGAQVIAVEPDSENIEYLIKNINANNLKCFIQKSIVSPVNGIVDINIIGSVSNSIVFTSNDAVKKLVKSITMQDMLDLGVGYSKKYKILKMDVEGAEFSIFKQINALINKFDVIVMEIHDLSPSENIDSFCGFFDHNYNISIKTVHHLRPQLNTLMAIKKSVVNTEIIT